MDRLPPAKFWFHLGLALILGLVLSLSVIGGVTRAGIIKHPTSPIVEHPSAPPDYEKLLSATYVRVITGNVPVYQHPLDVMQGASPARFLDVGYVWVTLAANQPILQECHGKFY